MVIMVRGSTPDQSKIFFNFSGKIALGDLSASAQKESAKSSSHLRCRRPSWPAAQVRRGWGGRATSLCPHWPCLARTKSVTRMSGRWHSQSTCRLDNLCTNAPCSSRLDLALFSFPTEFARCQQVATTGSFCGYIFLQGTVHVRVVSTLTSK